MLQPLRVSVTHNVTVYYTSLYYRCFGVLLQAVVIPVIDVFMYICYIRFSHQLQVP